MNIDLYAISILILTAFIGWVLFQILRGVFSFLGFCIEDAKKVELTDDEKYESLTTNQYYWDHGLSDRQMEFISEYRRTHPKLETK